MFESCRKHYDQPSRDYELHLAGLPQDSHACKMWLPATRKIFEDLLQQENVYWHVRYCYGGFYDLETDHTLLEIEYNCKDITNIGKTLMCAGIGVPITVGASDICKTCRNKYVCLTIPSTKGDNLKLITGA